MAPSRIKGLTLKSRITFIEKEYGKNAMTAILPSLKPETKELFSNPTNIRATAWYDLDIQIDFDRAVCKCLAKGDEGIFERMGAFSAEFQSPTPGKKETFDPWKFLQMNKAVFDRYFENGRLEIVKVGEKEAYLSLFDFRSKKENCRSNLGYLRRSLELSGVTPLIVEETQCSEDPKVKYCEYHLKWQ